MKKRLYIKGIVVCIAVILLCGILNINKVEAAYFSNDIDGINESKYPGYKQKLKELQRKYPNIQLLYTGLNWADVINNESYRGRNLVENTEPSEWRSGNTAYDTGRWNQASTGAIEYVIDPRNWLDDTNIFQFQKLDTAVGTNKNDVSKVIRMQKAMYLYDDSISEAFANVASKNNINTYFLIGRVIQEQGRSGTSVLASGSRYQGTDGVTYEGYYNLFNIGATGNGTAEVYTNALKRAKSEGWTSKAKSITGGGNFVKDSFINVGQNTLYLQKFSVYNTKGQLYWNQYMTNLLAAKSEASLLLSNYRINNIQNDRNFQFIIPVYENMPGQPVGEPTGKFYGNVNTATVNIKYENENLNGEVDIAEWVNNVCNTPSAMPEVTLKSEDGAYSKKVSLSYESGIRYKFNVNISDIDTSKEYYIEAKLVGDKNMSSEENRTQKLSFNKQELTNNFKGKRIKIQDHKIRFADPDYKGQINTNLLSTSIIQNSVGDNYISGRVEIAEWIDDICYTPKSTPEIRIKSTDGSVNTQVYVSYQEGITYYFDKDINNLDVSKTYYIEAKLVTEENIAPEKNRIQKIRLGDKTIGQFKELREGRKNDITVNAVNNNFVLNYVGTINTNTVSVNLIQNGAGDNYISGQVEIAEWVNDICNTPFKTPEIRIKSTDGKINQVAYVSYENGIKYYFDKNIENWDTEKEYYIEVKLVSNNNIAKEEQKIQNIRLKNGKIGNYKTVTVNAKDNKFTISDSSLYKGNVNTQLYKIKETQVGSNLEYLMGEINIAEWVDNICNKPTATPKMTLKSTDGKFQTPMFVSYINGISYYFDKCINSIDTSKEYYIEVELTGNKNIAPKQNKVQIAKIDQKGNIGKTKSGEKVTVTGNNIKFETDTYKGNVNTELYKINAVQAGANLDYLMGEINIAEWVDNVCNTPQGTPKMTLKSTDGKFQTPMYVSYMNGITYYFDKCIEGIDTSKEYYIEVELTGKNNVADKKLKIQNARMKNSDNIGKLKNNSIAEISNGNIKFKK